MTTVLKDCIITNSDAEVVRSYTVALGEDAYHLGIDLIADQVYCPCYGVAIYTGLIDGLPSCTVQYSNNICLRFTHLSEVQVNAGDLIVASQVIGLADEYVHFEYLTSEATTPAFRVFFNASQTSYYLYKHDPMLVLLGNVQFDNTPKETEYVSEMQALYEDGPDPNELIPT